MCRLPTPPPSAPSTTPSPRSSRRHPCTTINQVTLCVVLPVPYGQDDFSTRIVCLWCQLVSFLLATMRDKLQQLPFIYSCFPTTAKSSNRDDTEHLPPLLIHWTAGESSSQSLTRCYPVFIYTPCGWTTEGWGHKYKERHNKSRIKC